MLDAAIIGLGRWGQNYVNSVQGVSTRLRFTRAVVRNPDKSREFADKHGCASPLITRSCSPIRRSR